MILILLIAQLFVCVYSSNILMVLPLGSRSHKNIFIPLAEKLTENGHNVTLLSMYQSSVKSLPYKDIAATAAEKAMKDLTGEFNVFKMLQSGVDINTEVMKKVITNLPAFCDNFIRDPAVEEVWNSKPDIILLPAFMNECGLIFVQKFQVPFIYVTTSGLTPWTADLVGNPEHPAYVPNQYLNYGERMNLWQRTWNTLVRVVSPILRQRKILNAIDGVAQRFLRNSSISLGELEKNVSLVLVNSHHSLGFPRPLLPNVIEVGGMQCKESTSLATIDPSLNAFLNDAGDKKVLLVSFGSHMKGKDMPSSMKQKFINSFAKLPYKIVWKFEDDAPLNLSSNVMVRKWLPQQDLLGHPSMGAFFTHGGLLSTQEAVYHGIPIVGLPIMSDQPLNVKQAEQIGIGLGLNVFTLTEDAIIEAVTKVMEDPSFRKNVQLRSSIMKDQETTPLDRATYWTEYVLRHGGAEHLKSQATSLSTAQYLLLDVLCVIIVTLTVLLTVVVLVLIFISWVLVKMAKKLLKLKNRRVDEHQPLLSSSKN